MTSSNSYNFSLSNADIVEQAFSRIQIRRTALLTEHLRDGWKELNLALVRADNIIPNLWTYEQTTIPLIDGTATYTLPARTVNILSCFIRTGSGESQNDRTIFQISTTEYSALPNKNLEGFANQIWFNRAITPEVTFWPVPDQTGYYTAYFQIVRQIQDANLPGGETPDLPIRFLDAIVAEVAFRLARIWKPELEMIRKQDAVEAWNLAATQDTENVSMTLAPNLNGYFRR